MSIGGVASPANAAWNNGVLEANEAAYYYSANLTGSFWDTDVNTANYSICACLWPLNQAQFVSAGSGKGTYIYNNSASLRNNRAAGARSYYSVNYAGLSDYIQPNTWANLVYTRNNNRSFKWI